MKCEFRLIKNMAAQHLLFREKESQVGERQRERICVCVQVLVETKDSVDQHPQTTWGEKHMKHIWPAEIRRRL
jgi:hypothetical protein